jgi:hypothetical protein
MNHIPTV